jgi:hypothetical protein
VTAILPRGKSSTDPVMAGWFSMNGNGEMTGTTWIKESGFLEGPVFITNTHSVGVVRDAAIAWGLKHGAQVQPWSLPVVAETYDGGLNDINGFHVKPEHVFAALDGRARRQRAGRQRRRRHRHGLLPVQVRHRHRVAQGGRAGGRIHHRRPGAGEPRPPSRTENRRCSGRRGNPVHARAARRRRPGARLDHHRRRDRRAAAAAPARTHRAALLRSASPAPARRRGNGSGDIFIAFSTANAKAAGTTGVASVQMVSNDRISALFSATVQATEEAIVNALVAGETMRGVDDRVITALPHDTLKALMKKYGR